jgi:hypothetical protein
MPKLFLQNCTPHTLNIHLDGQIINIEPSSIVPRVVTPERVQVDLVEGIPIFDSVGDSTVEDLPEWQEGVYLVVSRVLATACPHRDDLLVPGTLIRDDKGRPIGCNGLDIP